MPKNSAPSKKRGTKPKPIDLEQLAVLAGMQCTYEEIAAVFRLKKRAFINRVNADPALKTAIEDGWAHGRASIRRQQFSLLAAGNATMAVWLGKNYLGQRDNLDTKLTGSGPGGEIQIESSDARERILSRISAMAVPRGASEGDRSTEPEAG